MKKANLSLRNKVALQIIITVVISIFLVAAAGCVVTVVNYNKAHHAAVNSELKNCASIMDSWLNEKKAVTEFMARDIELGDYTSDYDKCLEYLKDCITRDTQVFDCYIGLADTSCIFGGGWEPAPGEYDPTIREWYIDAVNTDDVIITDPYTDAQTGKQVVTFAIKLQKDGQVVGVLARDMFIDRMSEIVNELHIDEKGYALLITEGGSIISHKNDEYNPYVDDAGNDVLTPLSTAIAEYPDGGTGGEIVNFTDYDGSKIFYSEAQVDTTGWKVGYALNSSEYNHTFVAVIELLSILSVLFAIVIALWVTVCLRMAFKPLKNVAETAKKVADGSLDVSFDYNYNDEIGDVCQTIENNNLVMKNYIDDISSRLDAFSHGKFDYESKVNYIGDYIPIKRSLDNIGSALANVFSGIGDASTAVFGGAGGVADGANHLAESVSKQTVLINEITEEMNKVSTQVSNNVERTDEARGVARKTADVVKTSSEQMSELLKAMDDISHSSEEIKNIIKTIEDIAFQTNILALNASVEAARAGEAGKGFAVVADEVRNLAGKSSEASEQTAVLIERSTQAVNNGMKYAGETSDSLNKVVAQTGEIDDIIVKINEESHEQMISITSVRDKMGLVTDYVTSAAANAEESAASSQELNGQAASLRDMLRSFGL